MPTVQQFAAILTSISKAEAAYGWFAIVLLCASGLLLFVCAHRFVTECLPNSTHYSPGWIRFVAGASLAAFIITFTVAGHQPDSSADINKTAEFLYRWETSTNATASIVRGSCFMEIPGTHNVLGREIAYADRVCLPIDILNTITSRLHTMGLTYKAPAEHIAAQ